MDHCLSEFRLCGRWALFLAAGVFFSCGGGVAHKNTPTPSGGTRPSVGRIESKESHVCRGPCRVFEFGVIEKTGLIDCFDDGLTYADGSLVYCETSAAVLDGKTVILASDQRVPGSRRSSVFRCDLGGEKTALDFITAAPFKTAVKYEDAGFTPDRAFVFLTTGFDRVKADAPDWDPFNTLLCWPAGGIDDVAVVNPSERNGIISSVGLRRHMSIAMSNEAFPNGVPYFKIEGLTCIPGGRMLLGVRERGANYKEFDYVCQILIVLYQIENGTCILHEDMRSIYQYAPQEQAHLPQGLGLSSLEYDPDTNRIYILTTVETSDHLAGHVRGFLMFLSPQDLMRGRAPYLVYDRRGRPLESSHKWEGVTRLSSNRLFIVHDDDRIVGALDAGESAGRRKPHQTSYSIVTLTR